MFKIFEKFFRDACIFTAVSQTKQESKKARIMSSVFCNTGLYHFLFTEKYRLI